MTIIGIAGAIGSGKSHTQLKTLLAHCELKRKQLVLNFEPNVSAIYDYATYCNMPWVRYMCLRDAISWIVNPKDLQSLLIPESCCGLDEAGIYLNSRSFKDTPKALLADLAQSRKFGCDLIYCAQFDEQVDRQMRLLTQYWVHCASVSFYDKQLRRPSLKWKKIYTFTADSYHLWLANPEARTSHFKTRFAYSTNYEGGLLSHADKLLFKCFESFDRLDNFQQSSHVSTSHRCELPGDYYCRSLPPVATLSLPASPKIA
jgi:hypothetical protein